MNVKLATVISHTTGTEMRNRRTIYLIIGIRSGSRAGLDPPAVPEQCNPRIDQGGFCPNHFATLFRSTREQCARPDRQLAEQRENNSESCTSVRKLVNFQRCRPGQETRQADAPCAPIPGTRVAAGRVAGSPQSRRAPGRPAWTSSVEKHAFRSDGSLSGRHRDPGRVLRPRPGILSEPLPRRARIPISRNGRIRAPPIRQRPVENHGVHGRPDRGSLPANPATPPSRGFRRPC